MTTQTYFWINHAIYASRERVFQAWTEPEEVRGWHRGETIAYREVDPPSRLVFAIGGDEDLAIVTLSTVDDHTVMTFEGAAPVAEADAVEKHWSEMLYRLADQVIHSGGNTGGILPG